MKNPYKVLGIKKNASETEIRLAFNKMALRYHPDRKQGSEEKFKEISEAYSRIKNEKRTNELDIAGFEAQYRDSEEEVSEIKSLYNKFKGDICKMIDNMIIGRDEDEERIRTYVNKWIGKGEVVKYSKFEKKVKDNKRRLASRDREAALIEKLAENSEAASKRTWSNFLSDLESKYGKKAVRKKK